jgi:hypothetical protein
MLGKYAENITAAVYNIALHHGLGTAKTASKYFCPLYQNKYCLYLPQCQISYVGIAGKTTACNLALSRSDMFDHTPTSHSFTDVSGNKLLLRFISYVKHSLYKNNTFSKAVVSCTHLKCCYFAVSLHSFRSLCATQYQLNAQRLPTAQN